jgi:hypothetical protein
MQPRSTVQESVELSVVKLGILDGVLVRFDGDDPEPEADIGMSGEVHSLPASIEAKVELADASILR